ncbi:hypothetical protein A8F94_23805 [Bacillus sp. FJAT-27225]|uniref:cupin domain-containing protein n=1 Tax=Bacillus sp. FJAT-27225 TaxID=1743144 RepID=UPI00080C31E3|nr:cupin domain-containing protein [Bacillus sp. FJAT-27225]OCA89273.1 hypothetical protein A8F94_23805 [Bacillus sp. FJAT-27225]
MKYSDVKVIYLLENRYVPGKQGKPVLYYPGALKEASLLSEQELVNQWSNGVSGYSRNHRYSHEVLGVIQGSAALELGGERKVHLEVKSGDLIVFPSGIEKRHISVSPDFRAAGFNTNEEDAELANILSEVPFFLNNGTQYYQLSFNI